MLKFLASRRNIVLLAVAVWLLLDVGRSLYARVAYQQPFDQWDGQPYDAELTTWPPASWVPANAALGEKVYLERCAVCHGVQGDGRGLSAPSIYPRPRDFTLGIFKYKSTAAGEPPTDEDLTRIVSEGLRASTMPYFNDVLSEAEINAVVAYVKAFSPVFAEAAPTPLTIPERVAPDAASLERGAKIFQDTCAACHGPDGRIRATLKDANGFEVHTRDLTAPWTFKGGDAPEQIWLRVTIGLAPSPMPSFAETLTDAERWDVTNYVLSLARVAPWEAGGVLDGPGHTANLTQRGEYITHYSMCGLCHTQVGGFGIYRGDDHYLSGGMTVTAYPYGTFGSRNLTSDPATGLGERSVEEVATAIRFGKIEDRSLNFFLMPWVFFNALTADDATAMATYLKTLPPVTSRIPDPMEYGALETIFQKLAASGFPVPTPAVMTYEAGSLGDPNPGPLPADWLRQVLVWAQWLTVLGAVGLWVWATPADKRLPRGFKGWAGVVLAGLGSLVVFGVGALLYSAPNFLPPTAVAEAVNQGAQIPAPTMFETPEKYALAQRGFYLYQTTACRMCHAANGEGGAKINGHGLGTVWSRNISADPTYGIGAWSDAEIARAIRSGVSADGRPLYWQGMPWDHFTNMDEEDVQALVVYVRTLQPVAKAIPLHAAPGPDDCVKYTFWNTMNNLEPGCK